MNVSLIFLLKEGELNLSFGNKKDPVQMDDDITETRRRVNLSKINYLILQGTAYFLLGYAALIWSKYSKGFWKILNQVIGIAFIIWGILDFIYLIYLLHIHSKNFSSKG